MLQTLADGPKQPDYQDIAIERGVIATNPTGDKSLPSTSWHDEFEDVNNDGLIDLFVAKGNIDEMPTFAMKDPNVLFLGQPDGTFVDQAKAAGVLSNARGRGAALVDLNLDGLLDLVVSNRRANAEVWRNVGSGTAEASGADGRLARGPAEPARSQPRRGRSAGRGQGRRRHHVTGADRGWR